VSVADFLLTALVNHCTVRSTCFQTVADTSGYIHQSSVAKQKKRVLSIVFYLGSAKVCMEIHVVANDDLHFSKKKWKRVEYILSIIIQTDCRQVVAS
jgi:hypothetical protein